MPRILPSDPDAKFCVSREIYFKHSVEAEAEFERMKDHLSKFSLVFYKKNAESGEWDETDWAGYEEEDTE